MQDFTTAESAVLKDLANVVVGVRAWTARSEGLTADHCRKLAALLETAPPIPVLSPPMRDPRSPAALAMFGEVLSYVRTQLAIGSQGPGLPTEHCRLLNRLANMVHNLPSILAGTHVLFRFDDNWWLPHMRAFDRKLGTHLEITYQDALTSSSRASRLTSC
jgi:hypothetical protein